MSIFKAISTNNYNSVQDYLIDPNILNIIDDRGYTPLLYAASVGLVHIVKLILNSRKTPQSELEKAIELSKENYFLDVARELEDRLNLEEYIDCSPNPKKRKVE